MILWQQQVNTKVFHVMNKHQNVPLCETEIQLE